MGRGSVPSCSSTDAPCAACGVATPKPRLENLASSNGEGKLTLDRTVCTDCGQCAEGCASGALRVVGREMSVAEVLEEVEKDRPFYQRSGGGVTLSGGEPLAQPEFAVDLLKACKASGVHTAVETCGQASWRNLARALPYIDLVLYDLKLIDPGRHKAFTGAGNATILGNARRLAREGVPMVVRIPVVPGYTDDEANLRAVATFAAELGNVLRVDLVPYHQLGLKKYEELGLSYSLVDLSPPQAADLERPRRVLESAGLRCRIGG